jgi:hypothetical protein
MSESEEQSCSPMTAPSTPGPRSSRLAGQLNGGRKAIVLSVWEPLEFVPFWGAPMSMVPPEMSEEVRGEAEKIAAEGAERARQAGFDAEPAIAEGSPLWQRASLTSKTSGTPASS